MFDDERVILEKDILQLCGKVGRILLTSGAETSRVESTVEYIGRAAGFEIYCHATMTAILVSEESTNHVHMVKIKTNHFNLQKVDEINTLSRQFTAKQISLDYLLAEISRIDDEVIDFPWPLKLVSAGFVSIAPMLLFEAAWIDLAWASVLGIVGYSFSQWLGKQNQLAYFSQGLAALLIAFLASLLQARSMAVSSESIVISALMPLVPGVAITNSFREIIGKDTISGLVRAVDALVIAGAIGGGVISGHLLANFLF